MIHLRDRFAASQRTVSCASRTARADVAYFADASADDCRVVIGGWEAKPGARTDQCRWFSLAVTPAHTPWFFSFGKGHQVIAASELLATTVCVALFAPDAPEGARGTLAVTSAYTDNRGNTYAAAKLHTTKFPLSCVVMELAAQLEAKGLWLDLKWTPREQNVHADALTNGRWERFDASLRVASDFSEVSFLVLPALLRAGAGRSRSPGCCAARRGALPP